MIVVAGGANRVWIAVGAIFAAVFSLFSLARIADSGSYLWYAATHGVPIDGWLALSILEVTLAMMGVAGMWAALAKRHLIGFVGFLLMQIPIPVLIESMRF